MIRVDVKSSREFRKFGTLRQQLEKLKVHGKRFVDIFKCRTVKQNTCRRKIFLSPNYLPDHFHQCDVSNGCERKLQGIDCFFIVKSTVKKKTIQWFVSAVESILQRFVAKFSTPFELFFHIERQRIGQKCNRIREKFLDGDMTKMYWEKRMAIAIDEDNNFRRALHYNEIIRKIFNFNMACWFQRISFRQIQRTHFKVPKFRYMKLTDLIKVERLLYNLLQYKSFTFFPAL